MAPPTRESMLPPPFGVGLKVTTDCSGDKGRTKQSFTNEADVNKIMARYHRTGVLVSPGKVSDRKAFFADVSQLGDYQEHRERMMAADRHFLTLPSEVRTRFGNSPGELVRFLEDPANRDEAIELGIVDAPPEPQEPAPASVPAPEGPGTTE